VKKGAIILLLGLLLGTAGFSGFYYFGTTSCREMMREPQPGLAWLKKEFKLSETEYERISQLHAAYLPQCAARCQRIDEQNQKLKELFSRATTVTPEIQGLLAERAKMRADCEAEMMKHFMEVSQTMPAERGRRYLAWVMAQTFLQGQAMEERHRTGTNRHAAHQHSM
jgi:heavy-metal resistance protein